MSGPWVVQKPVEPTAGKYDKNGCVYSSRKGNYQENTAIRVGIGFVVAHYTTKVAATLFARQIYWSKFPKFNFYVIEHRANSSSCSLFFKR